MLRRSSTALRTHSDAHAAQVGSNRFHEAVQIDGFLHDAVGSGGERIGDASLSVGAHNYDRDPLTSLGLANALDHLDSVHPWHLNVSDDQVWRRVRGCIVTDDPIDRVLHFITLHLQKAAEQKRSVVMIFDD